MPVHFIIRHFEKRVHPLETGGLSLKIFSRLPKIIQSGYVKLWKLCDCHLQSLNAVGRSQARIAAKQISFFAARCDTCVSQIIVSPYLRTRESATAFAEELQVPMSIDSRLVKVDHGARCEYQFDSFCTAFPEYKKSIEVAGFLETIPPFSDESHCVVRDKRVREYLSDLRQADHSTLTVTHKGVMDCVYQLAYGLSDNEVVDRFVQGKGTDFGHILVFYFSSDGTLVPMADYQSLIDPHSLYM